MTNILLAYVASDTIISALATLSKDTASTDDYYPEPKCENAQPTKAASVPSNRVARLAYANTNARVKMKAQTRNGKNI